MGLIKSTKKILRTVKVLLDVFRYGGKCYASKGIIANAYAPGIILTDMQPELKNKIGFVSPVRRNEAPDRCTAASNVI